MWAKLNNSAGTGYSYNVDMQPMIGWHVGNVISYTLYNFLTSIDLTCGANFAQLWL